MRAITTLALFLSVLIFAGPALTQSGEAPIWVSGQVSSIFQDQDGAIISLKMADGENYNISVSPEQLKNLQIGDNITVEIYRGWAELIEKADTSSQASPAPDKKKSSPQWVAGTVEAINTGETDSLLSIKLSNDKVFNVSASNDKASNIKVGDYITVKILRGWAQAISKK
ncbi:MAG: hypothetical protein AAF462_00170 [Thermodesulfobacteriota bacterium]